MARRLEPLVLSEVKWETTPHKSAWWEADLRALETKYESKLRTVGAIHKKPELDGQVGLLGAFQGTLGGLGVGGGWYCLHRGGGGSILQPLASRA